MTHVKAEVDINVDIVPRLPCFTLYDCSQCCLLTFLSSYPRSSLLSHFNILTYPIDHLGRLLSPLQPCVTCAHLLSGVLYAYAMLLENVCYLGYRNAPPRYHVCQKMG